MLIHRITSKIAQVAPDPMPTLVAHCNSKEEFERVKAKIPASAKEKAPRSGAFADFARIIFATPVAFLLAAPALWIIFAIIGAANVEVEDRVAELWTLTRGPYADNQAYKEEHFDSSSFGAGLTSGMLTIAKPRDGGNVMSEVYINEIAERLNATQKIEVRKVS